MQEMVGYLCRIQLLAYGNVHLKRHFPMAGADQRAPNRAHIGPRAKIYF